MPQQANSAVQLNTSRIGQVDLDQTLSKLNLPQSAVTAIENSNLTGEAEGRIHSIISSVARAINIKDFYSMYILDYCEGYYEPTALANATTSPTRNITQCANTTTMFTFNITQILESEIRGGATLADLDWPSDIQNAVDALNYAARAMFVLYCIGIGLTGLGMIAALFAVFAHGVLHAWLNGLFDLLAFICLGIASALATAIAVEVVKAVEQFGEPIGIAAYRGTGFLGLTWAATGLVLLATFTWVFDCCAGRRRERPSYKA